ncbi:MAG: ABC transporter permease [Clostridia bacterium]|nr:ABC transporter permease [Clostridia bacterium]
MLDFIVLFLTVGIPLSSALLLASLGESVNQRSGIFNLGCEGVMSMGAFVGMMIPYAVGGSGKVAWYVNLSGLVAAALAGALLGLLFGVVVIRFGAPQGIAGIGLQLFGTGLAGSLYRHFIGGAEGVAGINAIRIPLLSKIPILGDMLFSCNPMVYFSFIMVPVISLIMKKTPWGLRVRACGTMPRAADSMGIKVQRTRYEALAFGSAMAGLAGAYMSLCYAKLFTDTLIGGRGFIAVALVYFGQWSPVGIMGGALLFSLAQALQLAVQAYGFATFPYEFLVMTPYVLVIVVLIFASKRKHVGPASLGKPFNREMRV